MIPVTKPFLPPVEEYNLYLKGIWERQWITNMGPLASELELELINYLKTKNLLYVTNGTIAIQMAIKALDLRGEIITTPFSFVATTSCVVWESCTPIFVDIEPKSLNIDVNKIEEAITKNTSAILATHVYGNPCDVEKIELIAKKYNLKVIYDGAHAFGVKINDKSIFEYGDISTCSLHATKLYHSIEGGLLISKDDLIHKKNKLIRNFGITGFDSIGELGINGKNSEFHAAMGLINLKHLNNIFEKRKYISEYYDNHLKGIFTKPVWHIKSKNNYAYYPILLESEEVLLRLKENLENCGVQTRRYFYPSLADALPYLNRKSMPITDNYSKRVLCLPLYYDLTESELDYICKLINIELEK